MDGSTPGFPVLYYLQEFVLTHVHWVNDAIQPSHFLLSVPFSSCSQSFPTSGSFPVSQLFTSGGQSYWSFSYSISPSNEHSGSIYFKIERFELLAVQGTLKSLLQCYSLNTLILQYSAFFMVQLWHLYMSTDKKYNFDYMDFVGKWCLPLNMLSRFVIIFLPRSKCLLISWLKSPFIVILEPSK